MLSMKRVLIHQKCLLRLSSTAQVKISTPERTLALGNNDKWDLYVGICLERKSIITKDLTPLEKQYTLFANAVEYERSHKSDHEIRHQHDQILLEKVKKGEIEQGASQTAQDYEDIVAKEFESIVLANRKTEADKANDTKSIERLLDSNLHLIIEQKIGNDFKWVFPQGKRKGKETLRQVAERTLTELFPDVRVKVLGNAPWSIYKYKYPKDIRVKDENGKDIVGSKIFFFKANYVSGLINKGSKEFKDFHWMTKEELRPKLLVKYHNAVSPILLEF